MNEETDNKKLKIVVLGKERVGKSNLLSQFIAQNFEQTYFATHGAAYMTKEVTFDNGIKVKFEFWDTSGVEKYRPLSKVFVHNANAIILVYDNTEQKSFDEISNYFYREMVQSAKPDTILAVVANKYDLPGKDMVDEKAALQFAEDKKAIFCHTSAKDNKGIDDLFIKIAEECIRREK